MRYVCERVCEGCLLARKLLGGEREAGQGLVHLACKDGQLALVHVCKADGAACMQGLVHPLRHAGERALASEREREEGTHDDAAAEQDRHGSPCVAQCEEDAAARKHDSRGDGDRPPELSVPHQHGAPPPLS